MSRLAASNAGGPVAVLTRPAGQATALAAALRKAGWRVCDWPALELSAAGETTHVPTPQGYDVVVFVSGNAVRFYAAQLAARQGGADWPHGVPAAAVGPASAAAIQAAWGTDMEVLQPAADAPAFDSEALWCELRRRRLSEARVLIVRGGEGADGQGRGWLTEQLTAAGASVTLHAAYRRRAAPWPAERAGQIQAWRAGGVYPVWLLSSRQGVEAIYENLGRDAALAAWRGCRLVVPHERVAAAIVTDAARCGIATASMERPVGEPDLHRIMIKVCMPHDDAVLAAIVD